MPIHVPTISRRSFLARGAAAAAALAVVREGWSAGVDDRDPDRIALLSDTHIPDGVDVEARGVNMTANLRRVVGELCALDRKPSGVIINGDCAYLRGLPGDYANLADCVAPLGEAGLPLHLTMGNHDDRGPLYDALAAQRPERALVESKHVSVLESRHANWFLLDSLQEVNVVTGELGRQQREWLAGALDERAEKPAIVMAHHNPQFTPPEPGQRWGGIEDSAAFFELLAARPHVKAFVYGHTHRWEVDRRDGIHLINLPPVAYVFEDGRPNGWVMATVQPDGIALELRTIDENHPDHGRRVELEWA